MKNIQKCSSGSRTPHGMSSNIFGMADRNPWSNISSDSGCIKMWQTWTERTLHLRVFVHHLPVPEVLVVTTGNRAAVLSQPVAVLEGAAFADDPDFDRKASVEFHGGQLERGTLHPRGAKQVIAWEAPLLFTSQWLELWPWHRALPRRGKKCEFSGKTSASKRLHVSLTKLSDGAQRDGHR